MITSRSNSLIRKARSLRDSRARRESGLFLIEGLHNVGAALDSGWDLETLLFAPALIKSSFGRELIDGYRGQKTEVAASVLESIAGKEHPQGLVAIARQRTLALGGLAVGGCMLALEAPQDPGNVGSVMRTLDAVGARALILLDGGVDPFHPTVVRAAMGANFSVPIVECSSSEFLTWRTNHAFYLLGTSAHAEQSYRAITPSAPWILLLGTEQKGLSHALVTACDAMVSLPMRGHVSSLNLAVAAAILLYAYCGESSA